MKGNGLRGERLGGGEVEVKVVEPAGAPGRLEASVSGGAREARGEVRAEQEAVVIICVDMPKDPGVEGAERE